MAYYVTYHPYVLIYQINSEKRLVHSSEWHLFTLRQVDEEKPVLVPGDPESAHMKKVDKDGGIQYLTNQLNASDKLADMLNVPRLGSL